MFGLGSLFKLLSAISFILAWKFYKLPHPETQPNNDGEHDNHVLENSLATEMEVAMSDNEENTKLAPPTQVINVNALNGVVQRQSEDDEEVTIL